MSRIYKQCARLYPHERPCQSCPHKDCDLRDLSNPYEADSHEEKAETMFNEDQRELAEEVV